MKRSGFLFLRRLLKSVRGQTGVVIAASMSGMIVLGGVSVEIGHIYYAYELLVASTNAAALAGANAMPDITQATTYVTDYSVGSGQLNATPFLQSTSITPNFFCSSTVSGSLDVGCGAPPSGEGSCTNSSTCNALAVTQKAKVPLWFGGLIGMKTMNLTAVATAAMRGGTNTPWNIAIILDTTASMNDADSGAQCSGTQESCAQQGIQVLLGDLYPCALGATCTTSTAYVDSVSLFVFPPLTTATAPNDYTCPTSNPTIVAYTFPDPPSNTTLPSGDTYQVVTWANDYRTTDSATSLNQSSDIVIAVGDGPEITETVGSGRNQHTETVQCGGVQAPGGDGTYYAQAIYAAQAALVAEQTANPGSKNAMIILTDGDATSCAANANTSAGACSNSAQMVASEGKLNGTGSATTNPSGYESYAYPSALGECGQAVLAAQSAAEAGTIVYTIGYGAETSGGCLSDKTYSATVTTNGGSWAPGDQPCAAIAAMASASVNFYSDDGHGCKATAPSNQSITKLTAIFRAITDNMTSPRLIPNGTS